MPVLVVTAQSTAAAKVVFVGRIALVSRVLIPFIARQERCAVWKNVPEAVNFVRGMGSVHWVNFVVRNPFLAGVLHLVLALGVKNQTRVRRASAAMRLVKNAL